MDPDLTFTNLEMKKQMAAMFLVGVLVPVVLFAQILRWVYQYDGPASSWDEAWPMVLGLDGNLYAAGWSTGLGTSTDFTVISVTRSGQERWIYRYDGPANQDDEAHSIAYGTDGNIYAAGSSFGDGTSKDFVVVSLNSTGQERWVYRYNGPANDWDEARSIVCSSGGNVYAAGWSMDKGTDNDFTVISLDTAGNERWVYRYNGPANGDDKSFARSMAYGDDGNVYAAGSSEGIGTGDDFTVISLTGSGDERWVYRYNGPGNSIDGAWRVIYGLDGNIDAAGYSTDNGYDLTAISLTSSGQERWVYRNARTGRDQAWGLDSDIYGNVYPAGELSGNGSDFAVIALDSSGNEKWVYTYDGPANGNDYVGPVHCGSDGNIYATGKSYGGSTHFDFIIVSLDSSGSKRWVFRYNGPGSGWDNGESVIYGPDGCLYAAGSSTGISSGQDFTVLSIGSPSHIDVGAVSILSPLGMVDSGTVHIPCAVVRNFGNVEASFPVTMQIGTGYSETVQETLPAGISDTIKFPSWTAAPCGTLQVTCHTSLTGDENPANDTAVSSVIVTRPANLDVGVVCILSPTGTVDSGMVFTPYAVVRNFGTTEATFPVTMQIGTGYTEVVQDTLLPSTSDTVSFPSWTAIPVDTLKVICYTNLSGDENPANDTTTASVIIKPPPVHDIGTAEIFEPKPILSPGDTVRPRVLIRNFGTCTERYFAVRFRIGSVYNQIVNAGSVAPNSAIELSSFPPWAAVPGYYAVSCSTMLVNDTNPTNDKKTITIAVKTLLRLFIKPDTIQDRIRVGETKPFDFYAELQGDGGDVVELTPPVVPAGWGIQLYDADNIEQLTDTDGDGVPDLGFVACGTKCHFNLRVKAPEKIIRDVDTLPVTFVIRGFTKTDSTIKDSSFLVLILVPNLGIHNYPNPLTTNTTFWMGLPDDGTVSLTIYDRAGECIRQLLVNEPKEAKVHLVSWNATNDHGQLVAPGTYQYLLEYIHQGKTDRIVKKLVVTRE